MRRAVAAVFSCVLAALAGAAAAQSRPPAPETSDADMHRVRGAVAWRLAAWRLRRDEWLVAAAELEAARKADIDAGKTDFTVLGLLGVTYLRLAPLGPSAQLDAADIALGEARKLDPKSPRLAFADALRETVLPEGSPDETKARVLSTVEKFDEFFRGFAHPEEEPFAAELQFLGRFYRGRARARLPEALDGAVSDLTAAMKIAEENKRTPPVELVSLLAQVHMTLNQVDDAKRVVADALARDPAEALNYYNLAQLLLGAKDLSGARSWFEAALLRRPDFPEARMALALIAKKTNDPAAMRRHLEAAAALQQLHAKAGAPIDARTQADLDCGFGICWKLVGDQRADAGDDAGMRDAFATAKALLHKALSKEPGCFNAVNYLIQIAARTGAPQSELDELKARIEKLQKPPEGGVDPFRSTFC